ncbi:MAG TPA: DUF2314 domain-containing protein [Rhodopseudomonas sp.]|uniref:DUF2314 domain-containing protein n=1 Tax=Rhodopseudomonas sp. TaxID=1078 RepID=UPI002EDA0D22
MSGRSYRGDGPAAISPPQTTNKTSAKPGKARAGMTAFLAPADRRAAGQRNFSVRSEIPLRQNSESLWIRRFEHRGDQFVGRVVNAPRNRLNLKYGDRPAFTFKDIADWSYLEGDQEYGLRCNERAAQTCLSLRSCGLQITWPSYLHNCPRCR